MKMSKYLTAIERGNGELLIYSAITGAVLRVSRENSAEYAAFCQGALPDEEDPLVRSALTQARDSLKEAMILLDDDVDELKLLAHLYTRARYADSHRVVLCVAPTMKCNLSCSYCFNPQRERRSMASQTMREVANYFREGLLLKAGRHSVVQVTWTGGEPLCDMKATEGLAGRLYAHAVEHDCFLYSTMITNGTLLTPELAATLSGPPFCVRRVQVTLDGPRHIHDTLRVPRSGKATFDAICENARQAMAHLNVTIRIGVAPTFRSDDFETLLDELHERRVLDANGLSASMFMARISPCRSDRPIDDGGMPAEEYAAFELECARIARRKGVRGFALKVWDMPSPVACSSLLNCMCAIDNEGYLSKCMESFGRPEEALGHVTGGLAGSTVGGGSITEGLKWDCYNPFLNPDKECIECSLVPLCGGGCPRERIAGVPKECSPAKYNLKERLLFHYLGE